MKWLARYYEQQARFTSLNVAILLNMCGVFFFCDGFFFQIGKWARSGDRFWLYLGVFSMVLGPALAFIGFLLIHAAVRRLQSESGAES